MNILITGAKGFVGKNLCEALKNIRDKKDRTRPELLIGEIFEYDVDSNGFELEEYLEKCDFVFNLAGVNRPENPKDFIMGNVDFLEKLLNGLKEKGNVCPVMLSSSVQAELDNDYGKSKKAGEELLMKYSKETGAKIYIYRFTNLFGKWSRPNYNSVVATFCNNIANDLPIKISDPEKTLTLCYIDDVINELLNLLEGKESPSYKVLPEYKVTLKEIASLIESFKDQPRSLLMPKISEGSFEKKLYSTYLSYLPKEKICFDLKTNSDERGSFTEILKTLDCGQISVNVSKPGITKGQHWHNSKWELFIVVSGHALITQRKLGTDEVISFEVSSDKLQAVHMLPGYTHNIINLSDKEDLVTLMWANENFDPEKPDTFFEVV